MELGATVDLIATTLRVLQPLSNDNYASSALAVIQANHPQDRKLSHASSNNDAVSSLG
jgi:hypothetical protein